MSGVLKYPKKLLKRKKDKLSCTMNKIKYLNVVLIGDCGTGKTSVVKCFKKQLATNPVDDYVPTLFDTCTNTIKINGHKRTIGLWDTSGSSTYDRLRPLAYPQSDAVLICYSIDDPRSFYNITAKWNVEIDRCLNRVPKILVATKKDKRTAQSSLITNKNNHYVGYEQGLITANKIGASLFLETSAISDNYHSIRDMFEQTIGIALYHKAKKLNEQER